MIGGEIRVGLVDGDLSIREGRKLLLNIPGKSVVVFEASRAIEAIEMTEAYLVDVLIIDQRIQGMPGTELARKISKLKLEGITSAHILMTAPFANKSLRLEALRAGAQELISQEQGADQLLAAVRKLVAGEVCVDLSALRELVGDVTSRFDKNLVSALETFTPKETAYIRRVVEGESIAAVAGSSQVAAYRVRKPVEKVLSILGLTTLEQLQLRCIEAGLLEGS